MRLNDMPATLVAKDDKIAVRASKSFIEEWDERYEKGRKIRLEKFWAEFFERHFSK